MAMNVGGSGPSTSSRIVVAFANLIAFAALAAVLAYWGWRWFGPAAVHIPAAPVNDPAAVLAVSPPFGAPSGAREPAAAPAVLAGDTRLLGVLSEADGKGRALFRFADGSARLVAAGETLSSGATLVAVRPDGVTIRDAGGERAIALRAQVAANAPTAKRASAVSDACKLPSGYKGPVVKLNAELVQGLIAQPESLRAVAAAQGGSLVIREEAGFAAMLGMRKGDRVAQANGIALRTPDDVVVAILRPLAASQPVRLTGSRGSEPRELMILNASVCPN
jgi:type II secretory pathway component PulC